jgi:uncharacterized membrane protein (UPF0127 family)
MAHVMTRRLFALATALGVAVPIAHASGALPAQDGHPTDGDALVIFDADTIRVEVAATAEERQQGLMFRNAVPDGTGMLFVFPRAGMQSIWMKNTYVPLDVAFLDATYTILNIEPLEPESLATKSSTGYALFALEVRQGWFADHGVEPGDRAAIVFAARPSRR